MFELRRVLEAERADVSAAAAALAGATDQAQARSLRALLGLAHSFQCHCDRG